MEKFGHGVLMVFVAAVVMMHAAAAQTVHVVGDSMGWSVPTSGGAAAYTTWASSKRFMVGDILTFEFPTNAHDVLRVTKESYDACTSTNPIGSLIVNGPANVTLTSSGDHFFICTVGRHCLAGQKLSISVIGRGSARSSAPSSAPTASPDRTGGPTAAPKANSPAAAVPAGSAGGPVTGPPSPSSSAVLAGSAFISMVSVVMSLVF